jgi:hypothetical protein
MGQFEHMFGRDMSATSSVPSILDVLENYLGDLSDSRVDRLTGEEISELAERVNEFYENWTMPEATDLRMYAGGWIAGNFVAAGPRAYLYTTLLYYPQTIIHDPVADWFFPRREKLIAPPSVKGRANLELQGTEAGLLAGNGYYRFIGDPERTRLVLKPAVQALGEVSELIRAGVIIPVPQWWLVEQRQSAILTAVRHDVGDEEFVSVVRRPIDEPAPRSDHVRGMAVVPEGGWARGEESRGDAQDAAYFLNKTLAVMDGSGSLYVPPAATDAKLFELRADRVVAELRRHRVDLHLARALANAHLPFLGDLDPKTLLAVRRDEQAFADWRAELRSAVRTISSRPSDGDEFDSEAKQVMQDLLLPKAHEVKRLTSTSAALRDAAKAQALELSLGTASLGLAASAAHQPFDQAALAALGVSAVARWVLSPLLRASPTGTKAVLATLVKKSSHG